MLYPSSCWPDAEALRRLVREANAGSAEALEQLLTILRPALLAFFRQRYADDGAEDLTQLALIRISRAIGRIDHERADSYISTVARNLLRTAYRTHSRDRARDGDTVADALPSAALGADLHVEYAELALALHRACLTKLAPPLRDVAVGLLNGESTSEIADSLGISPITVRTRLIRARSALRTELAGFMEESTRRPL